MLLCHFQVTPDPGKEIMRLQGCYKYIPYPNFALGSTWHAHDMAHKVVHGFHNRDSSKGHIASLVGYAPCILLDVVGIVPPHNDRPVHFRRLHDTCSKSALKLEQDPMTQGYQVREEVLT